MTQKNQTSEQIKIRKKGRENINKHKGHLLLFLREITKDCKFLFADFLGLCEENSQQSKSPVTADPLFTLSAFFTFLKGPLSLFSRLGWLSTYSPPLTLITRLPHLRETECHVQRSTWLIGLLGKAWSGNTTELHMCKRGHADIRKADGRQLRALRIIRTLKNYSRFCAQLLRDINKLKNILVTVFKGFRHYCFKHHHHHLQFFCLLLSEYIVIFAKTLIDYLGYIFNTCFLVLKVQH